jgi:hypothetical protein
VQYCKSTHKAEIARRLQFGEVLDYAGVKINRFPIEVIDIILEHKKEFLEWAKEEENKIKFSNSFRSFEAYLNDKKYAPLTKILKSYDENLNFNDYKYYFPKFLDEESCSFVGYFFTKTDISKLFKTLNYGMWNTTFKHAIATYLTNCKYLEKKPEKTRDIVREMVETNRLAELKRQQEKNILLEKFSKENTNLFFEDENYTIVIPKSVDDFVTEGEKQKNCVGGYVDYVIKGQSLVVFIREKTNPEVPFITCEITPNKKTIVQFLIAHNRVVTENSALLFKQKYQTYLNTLV